MNFFVRTALALIPILSGGFALAADNVTSDWRPGTKNGVQWSERTLAGTETSTCGQPRTACRKVHVEVRNDKHEQSLYCGGELNFVQPILNRGWVEWIEVKPGQSAIVGNAWAPFEQGVKSFASDCRTSKPGPIKTTAIQDVTDRPPLPPPPPPRATPGCRVRVARAVNLDDYYPPRAKIENREGRVAVRVTVADSGFPSSVDILESSSYADIDEAAVRAMNATKFTTDCPDRTGDFAVKFSFHF